MQVKQTAISYNSRYDDINVNASEIPTRYESVIKLKRSLENIELLIGVSEDQQEKQELNEMKNSVVEALSEEMAQIKQLEQACKVFPLSPETITDEDVGKLTKCLIQNEPKPRNAQIQSIDLEEQTAVVKLYGKAIIESQTGEETTTLTLPAYRLKVLKDPEAESFQEGAHCKAIYNVDGEFYPCVIEKIDVDGYHIRYTKYNSKEVVKLHRLRAIKKKQESEDFKFNDLKELVIPEKLKIQPNDPENVKKSKKTKVKALKFAFKNAQVEEVNKQQQAKWQNFNSSGIKYGHFQTKNDMNATSQSKEVRDQQPLLKNRVWSAQIKPHKP